MTRYMVRCDIGAVYAHVEADSEDDAITAALEEWDSEALDLLSAGTFTVHEGADDD